MADSPTQFFKFIRPGFLFNLSIPKSFLKNLNGEGCFKAILKREGHEWPVDIADGVFGGDGWRRFVRENGVQEKDFIVFDHQGDMMFEFVVYDYTTSCEKDYPNLFDEEMEGEEHLTSEEDTIRTQRPKKIKKRKRNDIDASEDGEKFQGGDINGSCFISKMIPYVINKSRLHVPMKFAKSNGLITQKIYTQVYLMDDRQRSWPATLQKGKLELCLTGWHEFRANNHLKVGDVCSFELVKQGEVPLFKCSKMGKNFMKNHIQVKETSSSLSSHPYFVSNLTPTSFKRSQLYLPVDFSKQNGLKMGEIILKDDKGRSWKVHVKKRFENYLYIGHGLRDFLVGNGMKEGDEFKFELVEKEKDKPPIVNFFLLETKPIKSHKKAKVTREEVSTILCEEDDRPYFVGELKSCSVTPPLVLYLPIEFAKSNGLIKNKKMTLKNVEDERSWTVELKNHQNIFYYIGRGWKDFMVANGLKKGDRFKFELVSKGEKPIVNFYFQNSVEATRVPQQKELKKRKRDNIYSSEDGEKFQGDDSGCFKFKMTPYVINKSRLHVPMKFAISNGLITQRIYTQVYLMDDRQRSWPATLQKGKLELCLTGWHEFKANNHLKAGDVCSFELVKHGEMPILKCHTMGKIFVKNHIQVKETSSSLNKHPYFISNLKSTTFNRWVLYLPVGFAISNGLKIGEMILKDNKGRSWKVNLRKLTENQFYISGPGFRDFLVANGMKEGDEFKLELVEKVKDKPPIVNFILLKSKPIKSHKEAKSTRKEGSILCEEDGCPYFVGELKSCNIEQSVLYLSRKFAKSNGLTNNKKMTLKNVEDGRSWTVELKNHNNKLYYIRRGWKDFRVANGLKKGDRFKFVLVKKGAKPILNFYFQKSVETTRLPRQNKIKKVLEKTRIEAASLPDASPVNELEVPMRALRERRGHNRGVGHKPKSVSIDHQPPPPVPTKDTWSKKEVEKRMGKMCDKICKDFNASLQLLQEQQDQFFRLHSSNYQPLPPIQINYDPNQLLEDEDDESDD